MMSSGAQDWINVKRLREIAYQGPAIYTNNWDKMVAEGWRWYDNLKVADLSSSIQVIREFQHTLGKECVTIGQPFQSMRLTPYAYDSSLCGLYLRDVRDLVFSLHRDLSRWTDLTPTQLKELS